MCNYHAIVRLGMCNKPKVGNLQKRGYGCGSVALTARPIAYLIQCCCHVRIRREKEILASLFGPFRELVSSDTQFISNFLDARHLSCRIFRINQSQNAGTKSNP